MLRGTYETFPSNILPLGSYDHEFSFFATLFGTRSSISHRFFERTTSKMAKEEELQVKKSVTPPEIPLDWANLNKDKASVDTIRIPADVVEISNNPNENDLTIVGTAGQKITNMGRDLHKHCR